MNLVLRYFSLGLFIASLIIFVFFYYFNEPEINANDFTTEELIELIEDKDYRVITEKEYISYTVNEDAEKKEKEKKAKEKEAKEKKEKEKEAKEKKKKEKEAKEKKANEKKEKEEKKKKDDVQNYTLTIKNGMSSQDVSKLLYEKKIIKDANKFSAYLQKNDYSQKLKPGKFKLKSDMSEKEIAKAISK